MLPRLSSGNGPAVREEGKWRRKKSGKLEDKGKTVCVQVGNSSWREQCKSSMHREVALSCSMFVWIWKMLS